MKLFRHNPDRPPITPHDRLKRLYYALFVLTIVFGIANIIYLLCQPDRSLHSVAFCALQYFAMLLILTLPIILRKRFLVTVPLALTVAVAVFAFVAMIFGDGLNFYGKYPWWDSLLHTLSGGVLAFVGLWLVHIILGESDRAILGNKYFLAFYLVLFGLACGGLWEIIEYTYDGLFGTNTQQFYLTTAASLPAETDIPACGHEALRDTMTDLILDFLGSLVVAIYVLCRHGKLVGKHNIKALEAGFDD